MPNCYACGTENANYLTPWGEGVCVTCFNREFFNCSECGQVGYLGDDESGQLCYACYDRIRYWSPTSVPPARTIKKTKTARCFGVELETSDCRNHIALRNKTCFGVKEDGSIGGLEFYSPILSGDQGLSEIQKFCNLAKDFDVDDDCGFHLHIDMRGTTITERKRIAYAYSLTFNLWQHLVREDRWGNTYCEKPDYTPQELRDAHQFTRFERCQSRYQFVNLRAFHDHSTYELRGYQGTLDYQEICNWIKAHLRFVEICKDIPLAKLDELFGRGLKVAKRNMRKIFGPQVSTYYSKLWRKHAAESMV